MADGTPLPLPPATDATETPGGWKLREMRFGDHVLIGEGIVVGLSLSKRNRPRLAVHAPADVVITFVSGTKIA